MKNKKIITAFLAITFSLLSLLNPLTCVSAKMDQATTYQESNRKESYRKMSAHGTAVPNSGLVGNVYLNTALSTEEVVNLVSQLTYYEDAFYVVVINSDASLLISIFKNEGYQILFTQNDTNEYLFTSNQYVDGDDLGFLGWNPNFTGYLELNFEAASNNETFGDIGTQNEALISLFSITPFAENEDVSLIEAIGTGIANSAELFGAVLTNAFTALASVFITNNELTLLGTVLVIAIGATVVSFALKLILKLIQKIKV